MSTDYRPEMTTDYREYCLENDSEAVIEGRGKNIIPETKREPLWMSFLRKFQDPLIVVLLIVFFFSLGVSIYEIEMRGKSISTLIEPAGVLIALLLATGVGFIFEVKAEREFRILNKKKDERPVKVLRWTGKKDSGRPQTMQIKKCDVVKGDVVKLESGDEVPADGFLIRSQSLHVDESAFTGEMFTAKRIPTPDDKENDKVYARDFLLRASTVIEGNCLYRVTATGMETEEGRGAKILNEEKTVETPLNKQLDNLSKWITHGSYIIAILIVIGRMIYYLFFDGHLDEFLTLDTAEYLLDSILIAVALLVCAVPEGLPLSVTMSLAMSMRKMLKENNLVRKLHACETMGATTVICTDKTGTLTMNKLEVTDQYIYGDVELLARSIAVNSTADLHKEDDGTLNTVGNPTEGALLRWILKETGTDYHQYREEATIIEQVLFTPETKHMITVARDAKGRKWKYVKGAPEIVLKLCTAIEGGITQDAVEQQLADSQSIGRRTLGFAVQDMDSGTPLTFIGFLGMADPVRTDVREAIITCQDAGVRVIMVTGDVALTANQIGRESGIITDDEPVQNLTGEAFEAMSDEDLKNVVLPKLKVLSRARPTDKVRLVTLLQEMNQVVAVTGDGTNDALALKKAQVGLSMGDGTSRAKEASDITIIDNSFVSINKAIVWGRSLYKNIKRFLLFQMTINICACLIVLAGAFIGLDSPLTVTQMLWVNLIMDTLAAMALSSLPADQSVLKEKPRNPKSHIIDRKMMRQILGAGIFFFVLMFGLWQLMWHGNMSSDTGGVASFFSLDKLSEFFKDMFASHHVKQHMSHYEMGIFFSFFVMIQFWNLFNARYFQTGRSLIRDVLDGFRGRRPWSLSFSKGFLLISLLVLVGQILIVEVAGPMFHVSGLLLRDWVIIILSTSLILIIPDLWRFFRKGS